MVEFVNGKIKVKTTRRSFMSEMDIKPFGLLFEEPIVSNDEFIAPIYDEDDDISIVHDENGSKRPYVEYYGKLATRTFTKADGENSDTDEPCALGTRTITEVRTEASDDDDDVSSIFLSTKTVTAVKVEQTDEDEDGFEPQRISLILGTRTYTRQAGEGTDRDED